MGWRGHDKRVKAQEIATVCPHCGRENELASDGKGSIPTAGDVSICFRCLMGSIFTETPSGLGLRKFTDEEWAEVGPEVNRVVTSAYMAGAQTPQDALRASGYID